MVEVCLLRVTQRALEVLESWLYECRHGDGS